MSPASADSGSPNQARTWGTNGRVSSIVASNGRVYIGGTFTAVTDTSGETYTVSNVAVFLPATGRFDLSWGASTDGEVTSLTTDGTRVYLAGSFSHVDGQPREKLAAVAAASGALDTVWQPAVDHSVSAVALVGQYVYVGGTFTDVTDATGTHARAYVARVSFDTGRYDSTWAPEPDQDVTRIVGSPDGSHVYLGGDFLTVSGVKYARRSASIFTGTGAVDTSFRPGRNNQSSWSSVDSMATDGNTLLLGTAGSGGACTAYDATTGATRWSIHTNGDVQAAAIQGSTAYCGGHFGGQSSFGGQTRYKLASVDLASGAVQPFAPVVNSPLGLFSLAGDATHLYAGGDFTQITHAVANHLAMFVMPGAQTSPQPPTNLSAFGSTRSVSLTWAPPSSDGGSPVTSYDVYQITNGTSTQLRQGVTGQHATIRGLTNGTTYTFAVTAENEFGQSPSSAPANATPTDAARTVPDAPTGLTATATSSGDQLAWTAPANSGGAAITAYQIYRGESPTTLSLLASTGPGTSYVDTTGLPGSTYYYAVAATNSVGTGARSTLANATMAPTVPGPAVLSASSVTGGIALSWTPPDNDGGSPILKYVIVRDGVRCDTVKAPTTSYVDSGVATGTHHSYQVRVINGVGTSAFSNTVTATAG